MFKFIFISSVILHSALAQFADPKFFLEDTFSIPPVPDYDVEGSQCESDSYCEGKARDKCTTQHAGQPAENLQTCLDGVEKAITDPPNETLNARVKCGLAEVYQVTSVTVSQFVPRTRHKLCVPKHHCDRQRIDEKSRSARLFIFCGQIQAERLSGEEDLNSEYFNAAISDYQCVGPGHKVGDQCTKKSSNPNEVLKEEARIDGRCALLQTQAIMDVDVRENQPLQRQTLQVLCQPKTALDGIYHRDRILFMNNLDQLLCNRYTGKITPQGTVAGLSGDEDCPQKEIMSIVSITDNKEEADLVVWHVQRYYEMAYLRQVYYYPLFCLLCLSILALTFALLMYIIYWLNEWREQYVLNRKLSKLFKNKDPQAMAKVKSVIKTKAHKPAATVAPEPGMQRVEMEGSDDEGKPKGKHVKKMPIDIPIEHVTWDYKSFREWLEEKNDIEELDIDEDDNLDRVARFVAKTVDRLSRNLAAGTKTRIELFDGVRQVLVKKVTDLELKYICTHVGELLESNNFDAALNDKLRQMMAPTEEFFEKEVKIIAAENPPEAFVELEELENFKESAIYQDEIGQELLGNSQYSAAMFLRIYAHENYARFQQALVNQFSDRLAENWKVSNDYKKNAIKIWQSITDYEAMDWELKAVSFAFTLLFYMCQLIFIVTFIIVIFFLFCFQWQHLQKQTVDSLPFSCAALVLSGGYWAIYRKLQEDATQSFDNLKDLMRGCIETEIVELQDAYRHFKATPDIKVNSIKEELRDFQKVTVNYTYDARFVGEMEFRCRPFSPTYYATEFLSQIEEARRPIEVLQVLNHLEYFMSMNDYFETNRDKGKVSYARDRPPTETPQTELHILEPNALVKSNMADGTMTAAKNLYTADPAGREVRVVPARKKEKKRSEAIE